MKSGDIINERYLVDTPLSLRGYRQKFLGTDTKRKVRVILETLHDTVVNDPQALKGIRYEIELSQRLDSPFFMQFIEAVKQNDRVILVWQYGDAEILTNNSSIHTLTERDLCRFVGLTVKALIFAHSKGVIHGSLSTDNILITSSMTPIITGFPIPGALIETDPGTHGGVSAFKAHAPELLQGAAIDESCDFYSLGIIALYLFRIHDQYQSAKKRHPTQLARQFYRSQETNSALKLTQGLCNRDRQTRVQSAMAIADPSFFDAMSTPAHGTQVVALSKKEIRQVKKSYKIKVKGYSRLPEILGAVWKFLGAIAIALAIIAFLYAIFILS